MNRLAKCHLAGCTRIQSVYRGFSSKTRWRRCPNIGRHDNLKISYAIYQARSAVDTAQSGPIFILHGMFGSKTNWHSLAKQLTESTHRQVITLDARNHGDSDHAPEMDYLIMKDDLLDVMDMLKVEKPVLLGHSMGGKTIMAFALSVPERVESLIVVDTAPNDSPGADTLKTYAEKMKTLAMPPASTSLPNARRKLGKELEKFVQEESVRQFLLTNLKQSGNEPYTWRVNFDAITSNFHHLHSFPQFSSPCVSIRSTFIGGANSSHIDSSAEPAILKLFPGTTIQRIPGAGHWVHADKPTEFVNLVQKFILASSP